MDARVEAMLAQMTLDEQAALTAGDDVWHTPGVERLGIGRVLMSDGPSGVRGESIGARRSLSFPCGMAAGATWDVELLARYGQALAGEAHDQGVHVLLGPTIGIPRTPLGGRTFESFSEDPHLSARLTVAYVEAVQAHGVACCAKHFACNDQEHQRYSISAEVDETTMREIHLAPFEAAVREARVASVMAAYNRIDGVYAAEHPWLLTEVLRGDWGFDGVVVSDWLATHSTVPAAVAGLDIEMPGPPAHLGAKLVDAVRSGELDASVVEEMARRSLRLRARVGILDRPAVATDVDRDDPERRAVARELAIGGTVLLRNDGVLPLAPSVRTIAVVGPNGVLLQTGGGGSSQVAPRHTASFVDELAARLPAAQLRVEPGVDISRGMPGWDPRVVPAGIAVTFHRRQADGSAGEVVGEARVFDSLYMSLGTPVPGIAMEDLVIVARARVTPAVSGRWQVGASTAGAATVSVDGRVVIDNRDRPPSPDEFFGVGRAIEVAEVELVAGSEHDLTVRIEPDSSFIAGFDLGLAPVPPDALLERAVAASSDADVAIVVVGSNRRWESEGADRPDLHLPGDQDELIRRVVAANPRTVVVLNAGSPVDVAAADGAAALLAVWYPGEEGAAALADVVAGVADPGGRLPITFPRDVADVPVTGRWYPGSDGKVVYGEGLLVGYRHYDTNGVEPAFAFGHGLSYATFEHRAVAVEVADDGVGAVVTVEVANTSDRAGVEVVQLYVHRPDAPVGRPTQELAAFAKLRLGPGETGVARLVVGARSMAAWDAARRGWHVRAGEVELRIGSSSRSIRHRVAHTVPERDLPV